MVTTSGSPRVVKCDGGTHAIAILFSIVQRKALAPNDFATLPELARHLMDFGQHYRNVARPFEWTFTRADLSRVIDKIADHGQPALALAA